MAVSVCAGDRAERTGSAGEPDGRQVGKPASPRTTAVSETTTGAWKPTWSPGHTRPGLPPLTVVHDPHDDHAFMAAALAAHTPQAGHITVHPTPVASAPASLAHDLLRSMGKHLPLA
ncbi:hypothetical protein ACFQVA_42505 [Actinomadura keratinilytica]